MHILGISCFYHDAAAALLRDGQLVAAAQEERFTRVKHDSSFPAAAIAFCLEQGGIRPDQLDYVVFYEKPFLKFERLLLTILSTFPRSRQVFLDAMGAWLGEKLWVRHHIRERVGVARERILFCDHHLSHAASAFFCSPYDEAAILTVDGVGEWATTAVGRGTARGKGEGQNQIILDRELRFPHSLGLLYSAFTAFLGFAVNEGEHKVMGMAPFGKPRFVEQVSKLIRLERDGSFALDMSYFSFHHHRTQTFNGKFVDLFGPPRDPMARFATAQTSLFDDPQPLSSEEDRRNQRYADIAASVQQVTEEVLVAIARRLAEETGLRTLCLAGGVALNSVANHRILRETPFEEIFVQPAAGDAGGALGAALYVQHVLLGRPRAFVMGHAYWGSQATQAATESTLRAKGVRFERIEEDGALIGRVVDALMAGEVVGWFQGRAEWGPRALGNRSILADPRRADMKDTVNVKIKFREPFRPFAPSVLADRAAEFFELDHPERHWPARFMLYVVPVRRPDAIPAVTHVNGTGRLQTVFREESPRYARLIEAFGQASGVPVLLNTSFNLRGEPIVNTPEEALHTFMRSGMDVLVLGDALVKKRG